VRRLLGVLAAELGQQPAAAVRQQLRVLDVQLLDLDVLDQVIVERLEADRAGVHHLEDVVARAVDVGIAEHQHDPRRRALHQPHGGAERDRTGALGPDQRPRQIAAALGQQLGEVVARDPAGQIGIARADQIGVAVAERVETGVDLAAPPARLDDRRELRIRGRPT
jgi:hypothetical protein